MGHPDTLAATSLRMTTLFFWIGGCDGLDGQGFGRIGGGCRLRLVEPGVAAFAAGMMGLIIFLREDAIFAATTLLVFVEVLGFKDGFGGGDFVVCSGEHDAADIFGEERVAIAKIG